MKSLLLIPVFILALFATSCRTRTLTPLDPMTMKPSARCLPQHSHQTTTTYHTVHATK